MSDPTERREAVRRNAQSHFTHTERRDELVRQEIEKERAAVDAKTAKLKGHFGKLGISSVLIIAGAEVDTNFARAAANIAHVDVLPQQGANVYDILRRDTLVLTRDAVKHLEERLQ